jgi:hypothetical protein
MIENESPKSKKKMNMMVIILLSIIIAFLITAIPFACEGIYTKIHNRPLFYHEEYGGECFSYEGIFWYVLVLAPLTSGDEEADSSTGPILGYDRQPVMICFLSVLLISWIVLCLINRKFKVLLIVIGLFSAFMLFATTISKLGSKKNDTPTGLVSIRIFTTDIVSNHYVTVDYPSQAIKFTKAGEGVKYGTFEREYLDNVRKPEDVTKEQLIELIKVAEEVKANSDTDWDGNYTYRVEVVYTTRDDCKSIKVTGRNGYPEGWSELVKITNEICGVDFLSEKPEYIVLTPEWFSENFGINDEDFYGDYTVEDYLKAHEVNMQKLSGLHKTGTTFVFNFEEDVNKYRSYCFVKKKN